MINFIYDYFINRTRAKQKIENPKVEDEKAILEDEVSDAVITVRFQDGYEVNLLVNDIIGEYIKLRLMYHANFDRPDIIPYLYSDFHYKITQ